VTEPQKSFFHTNPHLPVEWPSKEIDLYPKDEGFVQTPCGARLC